MVPIRRLDPIGAIGNYWAYHHEPSEQEVRLLQALADSTSIAMENVQVYSELEQRVRDRTAALEEANEEIRRLSVTDELTGLNNRRGFYLLAQQKLHGVRRLDHNCVLAFPDVDGLKRVNDEQGHDVGDALLKDVAEVLRAIRGEADILARIGGDEFCVMVTESDPGYNNSQRAPGRGVSAFQCDEQPDLPSFCQHRFGTGGRCRRPRQRGSTAGGRRRIDVRGKENQRQVAPRQRHGHSRALRHRGHLTLAGFIAGKAPGCGLP